MCWYRLQIAGEHRNITQFYELFSDDECWYLAMGETTVASLADCAEYSKCFLEFGGVKRSTTCWH